MTKDQQIEELKQLLKELVDADPCEYDHNGCCQAHGLDERSCPHERAKKILGWTGKLVNE